MSFFEFQEFKRISRCSAIPLCEDWAKRLIADQVLGQCRQRSTYLLVGRGWNLCNLPVNNSPDSLRCSPGIMQRFGVVQQSWPRLDKECLTEVPSTHGGPMHSSYKPIIFHAFLHCSTTSVLCFTGTTRTRNPTWASKEQVAFTLHLYHSIHNHSGSCPQILLGRKKATCIINLPFHSELCSWFLRDSVSVV